MELKVHDQEILLQKLWKSQKLSQELHTTTGQKIEVLFAGRENLDSGPDFKDAVIKIDDQILKGDIEVHLQESGWYDHGHHQDPRYNQVVLHLISEPTEKDSLITREDGVRVVQLQIESAELKSTLWKSKREEKSPSHLSPKIVESCPLSQEEPRKILATVEGAGYFRFLQKVEQMREGSSSHSWDHLIYKKICESLGYSKNQKPFRKLADALPYEQVRSEMQWSEAELAKKKSAALLYGAAGLLPHQSQIQLPILDAEVLDYIAPLEYLWNQISHRLKMKPMMAQEWQFFRLRPQNFPTRRIAGVVDLLVRFHREGFLQGFLKIVQGESKSLDKIVGELESVLIVKEVGFWSHHYQFHDTKRPNRQEPTLIGKDRAREIIVNAILPVLYLYSQESREGVLANRIRELMTRYPKLPANSITRTMKNQLFRFNKQKSRAIKSAVQQQGLIELFKMYCKPLRCTECLRIVDETNVSD
ncbi:MAG: DUF2851 family protein [bacterium]